MSLAARLGAWGRSHPAVRSAMLVVVAASAIAAVGCAGTDGDGDQGSVSPPSADGPVVVTFEVADAERFRALLTQPDDIAIARRLLAGEDAPGIPNGRVVRETGVNEGWSWSLDPDDTEFAELTIEGCDGLPSDVEDGIITSDRYCPWSALVLAVDPAP